eukprot:1148495-Pelagomonas_calceolata.AAC.8
MVVAIAAVDDNVRASLRPFSPLLAPYFEMSRDLDHCEPSNIWEGFVREKSHQCTPAGLKGMMCLERVCFTGYK